MADLVETPSARGLDPGVIGGPGRIARLVTFAGLALSIGLPGTITVRSLTNAVPGDLSLLLEVGRNAAAGQDPYALPYPVKVASYLNPPAFIPFLHALAWTDPRVFAPAWYVLSIAIYLLGISQVARAHPGTITGKRLAWALACTPLWYTLGFGQIYILMMLAAIVAWRLLEQNRPLAAGLLLGCLVAIKPNLVVWPALLFVAGNYRAAFGAGISAVALSLLPAVLYGPGIYAHWLASMAEAYDHHMSYAPNVSIIAIASRLGVPEAGTVVSTILLAALVLWAWRLRPSVPALSIAAIAGAVVASPVAWVGNFVLIVPLLLARPSSRAIRAAALLLLIPPWFSEAVPVWAATLYHSPAILAYLLVLYDTTLNATPRALYGLWAVRRSTGT